MVLFVESEHPESILPPIIMISMEGPETGRQIISVFLCLCLCITFLLDLMAS